MIKNYFKIALRNFWRHKLFTFINIIGLSIGISAALVIYLIVQFDFSFDKFHKDGDRIYRVVTNFEYSGEPFYNGGVAGPLPRAVHDEMTGVDVSAPAFTQEYSVLIPGKTQRKFKDENAVVYTNGDYFRIFGYNWLAGSPVSALNEPFRVVLTSKQAKKYFPSLSYDQMIGKRVVYSDSIRTVVSGIVTEPRENTDLDFSDFISYSSTNDIADMKQQVNNWGGTTSSSLFFLKLSPKTTVAGFEKRLRQLQIKYEPGQVTSGGYKNSFHLQPLADIHFDSRYGAINNPVSNKTALYGLMIIAVFLLLLGCINFINLTTAQASQRAKEIGIRKTMGSNRLQLIGQFMSETLLITILSVIISIGLAPVILKLFSDFIPEGVKLDLTGHPGVLLFIALLIVVVSFLSGFYPSMVLSKYNPALVLKKQGRNGTGKTRGSLLRKSLTVTQFMIAQFFIMATILVSKQIYYALHTDLGFKKAAIINIRLPWKVKDKSAKDVFVNEIKALPQVEMLSRGGEVPSSNGWSSNDVFYSDGKKEIRTELYNKSGDENYIKVYKIKLLAGRDIRMADTVAGMLINQTYAHILGFHHEADAIGRYINFGKTQKRAIVGIVGDFHQGSLHAPIKPLAIIPQTNNMDVLHIALKPETARGSEWKTAIARMGKDWKQFFPDNDFDYHFFDESIAKMYLKERHTSQLLDWAAGVSILISCLGLLGLTIYNTNQRTKEIGVRKVLGASVAQIVTILSGEMVRLILLAFVIVTPVTFWTMHKWMETFADRTTISWWIFTASGAGMLLISLLTASFQTIKAAIANPVKSLRNE